MIALIAQDLSLQIWSNIIIIIIIIIIRLVGTTVRGTEPPDIPQVPLREKKKERGCVVVIHI